jgi:hypothetical protein
MVLLPAPFGARTEQVDTSKSNQHRCCGSGQNAVGEELCSHFREIREVDKNEGLR